MAAVKNLQGRATVRSLCEVTPPPALTRLYVLARGRCWMARPFRRSASVCVCGPLVRLKSRLMPALPIYQVYEMTDDEAYQAVIWALEAGYRHVDSAEWCVA